MFKYMKVAQFPAWGGPVQKQMGADGFPKTPTRPGRYVIATIDWFNSPRYRDLSGIRFGTPMRLQNNIVQVEVNGKWIDLSKAIPGSFWAKYDKDQTVVKNEVEKTYKELYGVKKVPDKWVFNDFGHVTITYFEDLNHNYKMDGKESIIGDMIHSTAENEASTALHRPVFLTESHGCVHIKPNDMDTIIHAGYAKKGQVVEVHPYTETTAPLAFNKNYGREPYELHFFPGRIMLQTGSQSGGLGSILGEFSMGTIIIYAIHKL